MPMNGAGQWERTPGTNIPNQGPLLSAQVNDETNNLINGINAKLSLSGQLPMTGPLAMGGFKITGLAAGVAATDAANVGQLPSLSGAALLASANVFTADQTIRSTDAGAGVGPNIILDRFSASPAANDLLSDVIWRGRDAGANATDYGSIVGTLIDPTGGSEDGRLTIRIMVAGALTNQLAILDGLILGTASGGAFGTGTVNATEYYKNGTVLSTGITLATEQATTSGTSKDFTGIPAGTKRITVMLVGVSTNGTSNMLIQLGDAGGIETTGYDTAAGSPAVSGAASTAGFIISAGQAAAFATRGVITLSLEDASDFTWVSAGTLHHTVTGGAQLTLSTGSKSLSAELTQLRITTVNGTDAFDAGVVNISYE